MGDLNSKESHNGHDFPIFSFSELFLILKWRKICYFFYFWILAYIIFAVSIGMFSQILLHKKYDGGVFSTSIKWILILSSSGLLGHALLQVSIIKTFLLTVERSYCNLSVSYLEQKRTIIEENFLSKKIF